MQFGYFMLSDNRFSEDSGTSDELIMGIVDEAVYAERLGYRSAWLDAHHFNSFVILSCQELALAYIAARTKKIRLLPAINVSPLHHPIRVAQQLATLDFLSGGRVGLATGRGFDRNEYGPFGANFEDNTAMLAEGFDCLERLWAGKGPVTHRGKYYQFENIAITPQPVRRSIPINVTSFSRATIDLAACLGFGIVFATFAANATLGEIGEAARYYKEACAKAGREPARLISISVINFADAPEYEYGSDLREQSSRRPEDRDSGTVLHGSLAQITDALKVMEGYGFDETILYFKVGFKSDQIVRDEMARFMAEVAPHFDDSDRPPTLTAL